MNCLRRVKVTGFKSIAEMDLKIGDLTVLIGANGCGKSNFVSLFRMLNYAMTGGLQTWIGESGGAESILHYGTKTTPQMTMDLEYQTDQGMNQYHARLVHAAPDTLMFGDESVAFTRTGWPTAALNNLGSGHKESLIPEAKTSGDSTAAVAFYCMSRWRFYQFHDTSPSAHVRKKSYVHDNTYLRDDGGNLSAYLYGLRQSRPEIYDKIVKTIRLAAPFFGDFELEPLVLNPKNVMLNWREAGRRDYLFGPHMISDGTLRFMALATLLLQPEDTLPSLIVIDEPELGLHPYAISLLGSMIRSVSETTQIVVSTQSVPLIDEFQPEDIVVVDRHEGCSIFNRVEREELKDWLEDYTISRLWEMNVIGGRPSR